MSKQVTVKSVDLVKVQGEMFKIQVLARSIEALIDANGPARYQDSDRFCDDDMTPLARIIGETALGCVGMLDALELGHSLSEELEEDSI